MPSVDLVVESPLSRSVRVKQLEAMFDVPAQEKVRLVWQGVLPFEDTPWHIGLFVGPSGSGKSSLLRHLFGAPLTFTWDQPSVIDDFAASFSIEDIAHVCQAVGFNTIPAWMRPFRVLSTGEQFRAMLARCLLEVPDPIVLDEFTSVVDRQVAQIGAYAVQKYIRKQARRLVVAPCHYDVIEWLQPDWICEPATMTFQRRHLQQRPPLAISLARVPYTAWHLFAPFHYLTRELHRAACCIVLFVNGQPASFAGMLHRPHPAVHDITGVSCLVTLPDWQGLGLALCLVDTLGSCYKALGRRLRTYPAHPSLIRSFDRSPHWRLDKRPGQPGAAAGGAVRLRSMGHRLCAVFEYCGPQQHSVQEATALLTQQSVSRGAKVSAKMVSTR